MTSVAGPGLALIGMADRDGRGARPLGVGGLGGSAAPAMDEQVDDIRAILDETGCQRAVLMGNWAGCAPQEVMNGALGHVLGVLGFQVAPFGSGGAHIVTDGPTTASR